MCTQHQTPPGQLAGGQAGHHVLAPALRHHRRGHPESGRVLADEGDQADPGQKQPERGPPEAGGREPAKAQQVDEDVGVAEAGRGPEGLGPHGVAEALEALGDVGGRPPLAITG